MTPHYSEPPSDWRDEHRVAVLIEQPAVRSALAACGSGAHTTASAEEFIAGVAAVLPMQHMRNFYTGAVERGRERTQKLGLKTGKQVTARIPAPVGCTTAAVLCSLARNGQSVTAVEQSDDGCVLTATIPSDAKTFGGTLRVQIRSQGLSAEIQASAHIPGQLYDWGKSKKTLATLVADVPALMLA